MPRETAQDGNHTLPPARALLQKHFMLTFLRPFSPAFVVIALVLPNTARAEASRSDNSVNFGPHRLSGEVGSFILGNLSEDGFGVSLGAGYAYRILPNLDLAFGARYFLLPDRTSFEYVAQPVGGSGPPQHAIYEGFHFWTFNPAVRPFLALDGSDRVELGLTARAGLLVLDSRALFNISLAPDVRVRIARGTALQLSPEVFLGQTGNKNGPQTEDYVNEVFGGAALWLSVVQTL